MIFGHRHYVPCMRWKQGEYMAMSLLSNAARDLITPLIEVPEKGFDFETWTNKKSIDEHLKPVAKRIRQHWQQRRCFVDLSLIPASDRLPGGVHPVSYVFQQAAVQGCACVPVTGLSRDAQYQSAVRRTVAKDKRGLCLRLGVEDAARPNLRALITSVVGDLSLQQCDLIFDLGALNFVPLDGFAALVQALIGNLPNLNAWRSFALIGTSFPANMGEVKDKITNVPRQEWLLYKLLAPALVTARLRIPAFGDYVISHPDVTQMDMRLLKPAATIRYAIDNAWLIVKGTNVRDNGFAQYTGHCKSITGSLLFAGANFSAGDKYIFDCAAGTASTGNLSTWRKVGTNHHLEKVARDVASFSSALAAV